MEASASILIEKPAADVFEFLADVANMPQWVSGVLTARFESGAAAPGATFRVAYHRDWRREDVELKVTKYEPPRSIAMETVRGPFTFEGHFELEEDAGATRLTNYVEAGADSLASQIAMTVFGSLLRRGMARRLQRELESLRAAMLGGAVRSDS
jgi:uncharacterized protein YndB with AHSA1/START domain